MKVKGIDKMTGFSADGETLEIILRILAENPQFPSSDELYIPESLVARLSLLSFPDIWQQLRAYAGTLKAPSDLLALGFAARGFGELYKHIRRLEPIDLGSQYADVRIHSFGSESLVFRGTACMEGKTIAAKLPFVDYCDMEHMDLQQLARRRSRLLNEAHVLRVMAGSGLPTLIDQFVATNPLFLKSVPAKIRSEEVVVITEFVDGMRADLAIYALHRAARVCCARRMALRVALAYFELQQQVEQCFGSRYVYTDIKPENAIASVEGIRIVDASSVVDCGQLCTPPVSRLYLEPQDLEAWSADRLRPDVRFVCRTTARVLRIFAEDLAALVGVKLPEPSASIPQGMRNYDAMLREDGISLDRALATGIELIAQLSCEHERHASTPI